MSDNMRIFNAVRKVPATAQKTITGGRLNGFTDINPTWRIQTLTEQFGPVGFGWKYEIVTPPSERMVPGANGEVVALIDINLFVKIDGEWSEAIPGTGGASFIINEKNGARTSDEAYKMALTDAISVACKSLGVGADIYWANGAIKSSTNSSNEGSKSTAANNTSSTNATDNKNAKPTAANNTSSTNATDNKKAKSTATSNVPPCVSGDVPDPSMDKATISYEDACNIVLSMAGYENKKLGEVLNENPELLKDIALKSSDKSLRSACVVAYNTYMAERKKSA